MKNDLDFKERLSSTKIFKKKNSTFQSPNISSYCNHQKFFKIYMLLDNCAEIPACIVQKRLQQTLSNATTIATIHLFMNRLVALETAKRSFCLRISIFVWVVTGRTSTFLTRRRIAENKQHITQYHKHKLAKQPAKLVFYHYLLGLV